MYNQCPKQMMTDNLVGLLENRDPISKVLFLSGFICSKIDLQPTYYNVNQLQQIIYQLLQHAAENVISSINVIEILVQASCQPANANKENLLSQFSNKITKYEGQIKASKIFLRQKWFKQNRNRSKIKNQQHKQQDQKQQQKQQQMQQQTKKLIKNLQKQQEEWRERQTKMNIEEEKMIKQMLMKQQQERISKLVQSTASTCQICQQDIDVSDLGALSCGHIFHRACIRAHIQALVNQKKVQIPCPSACGAKLPLQDIEQFIDGPLKQKFDQFCFNIFVQKNEKQVSWCPTPGCTAVFQHNQQVSKYNCMVCNKNYCLKCRCQYHNGMSCAQFRINNNYGEDDRKFQQFVRGAKFKQCPKCKYWVQRSQGCSSMLCRCGHEFCYQCGGSDCPHGSCKNKTFFKRNRRGFFQTFFQRRRR